MKDQDSAGGFTDLSCSDAVNGYIVPAVTADGPSSSLVVDTLLDCLSKRTNTDPTGLAIVTTERAYQSVVTEMPSVPKPW